MSKIPTVSPSRSSRSDRWWAGLIIGSILVVGLVPPAGWEALPDLCLFHRITGLPCPTCGLTRSWAALLRGHLGQSLHYHALGPLALAGLVPMLGHRRPAVGQPGRLWLVLAVLGAVAWTGYASGRMMGLFPGP
jgi:hypothetical protein